jgi:hypothetical protein
MAACLHRHDAAPVESVHAEGPVPASSPAAQIPIQAIYSEDVGTVKLGDYFTLDSARRELRGEFRRAGRMHFWNTWLTR